VQITSIAVDNIVGLIPEPPETEVIEQPKQHYQSGTKWRKFNIFYDDY